MWQESFLIWLSSLQNSLLTQIAYVFTFMGNETFYFLIIPFIYIFVSKKMGFRLLYIFLLSMYANSFLKFTVAAQRPVLVDGVNPLFIESTASPLYPYDSFPSGHSQGSTTLWGYLAYSFQSKALWLAAILLIFFISLSRMYAGLHWPVDIISGICIAVFFIVIGHRVIKFLENRSKNLHWFLAITVPIALFFSFPLDSGPKYSGFLMGAGISYLLEQKYVRMQISAVLWRKLMSFGLMLIGLFILQIGLKLIFPEAVLFQALRYALMGIWGFYLAPWLLVKLKVLRNEKNKTFNLGF